MKVMKKIIILLACLFFVATLFAPLLAVDAAEAFTIEDYHVELNVNEDGLVNVTETMNVHFDYSRHGIYFDIPTRYRMNWDIDAKHVQKEYYLPVTDIKLLSGQKYEVEEQSEGVRVIIGDANVYANEYETYILDYDLQLRDLDLDGRQLFYYNLIGSWDTVIKNYSFEIHLPKEFDASKMEFYLGANPDNLQYVETNVHGNTIAGRVILPIGNNASFTLMLPLEDGYFDYREIPNHSMLICLVSCVLVGVVFVLFMKYGKDDQVIVTVEFDAPEGISSAEVGYIIDGTIDNRDITSLILDWGNKGLLAIEEVDETNLIFKKRNEMDEDAPLYELRMFEALFREDTEVSTLDLREKFYTDFNGCKADLQNYLNQPEKRIYTRQSIMWRVLTFIVSALPSALFVLFAIYAYSWQMEFGILGAVLAVFPLVWADLLLTMVEDKGTALSMSVKIVLIFISLICLIINGAILFATAVFINVSLLITLIVWLCTIILTMFGMKMIKRTERGTHLYGRVLGLRDFILHAEYDRLKELVNEMPELFYHVLPYAYAMDLTSIWSEHFKHLEVPAPSWYAGHDPSFSVYHMSHRLNHCLYHAQNAMTSMPPVQASSGSGSFGGGSSGGFSGGGFGGSRGGSW